MSILTAPLVTEWEWVRVGKTAATETDPDGGCQSSPRLLTRAGLGRKRDSEREADLSSISRYQ